MNAVDTNILFYAHDPRDAAKQSIAGSLVQSLPEAALLWQVACEFLAASRKLEPFGCLRVQAWHDLRQLQRVWTTILPGWSVLNVSEQLQNQYSLSFWDATLMAACIEGGITRLYSEDFGAYPRVNGLEIINPFKAP